MLNVLDKTGLEYLWSKIKALFATKASPDLTGTPTAPTAATGTDTTQIATTAFVQDAISGFGNARIFQGTCSSAGDATAKVVVCPDFTSSEFVKGALIFVRFDNTNSGAVASLTMNVNSTGATPIKKQGNASSTNNLANAGEIRANSTYLFHYDGTNWVCISLDYNSTYSALSSADMQAGTATTGRTITAARVKEAVEWWMAKNQPDWEETDTTSPSYIANKPSIPSAVTENTVSGWGFTKNEGTLSGVSFNGSPASVTDGVASISASIPSAPGTLDTTANTAQSTNASEALSGSIVLHKVAKTGTYSDLIGPPTIPTASSTIPAMDGTASAGSEAAFAKGDHVHPHDTSKQDVLSWDNEPTPRSDNPVKSTGIYNYINPIIDVMNPPTELDLDSYTKRNYFINDDGEYGLNNAYKHIIVPVTAGDKITVMAKDGYRSDIAWFTSDATPVAGGNPPFVSGTTKMTISAGETESFIVPVGALYMYVYMGSASSYYNEPMSVTQSSTSSLSPDTTPTSGSKRLVTSGGVYSAIVALPVFYSGSGVPSSSLGKDGDIYLEIS